MSLITNFFYFNNDSGITDIIQILVDVIGIIVTASVSIWIVKTIQNKLNNERRIKDYFISEVSVIQNEYRNLISSILSGKETPKIIRVKFNNLNTKINGLLKRLKIRYKIEDNILTKYQIDLPMIVEDDPGYTRVFRTDSNFTLSNKSINKIYKLDRDNVHIFYDIIEKINDAN